MIVCLFWFKANICLLCLILGLVKHLLVIEFSCGCVCWFFVFLVVRFVT